MCILLVMMPPFAARIYVMSAVLVVSAAGSGACIGFLLGAWRGAAVGACATGSVAGTGLFLYLRFLHRRRAVALRAARADGFAEGTADVVLFGILLYEGAVFPFAPQGVSQEERQARRTVAYRLAAYDGLPREVRVAAAEALEAIDEGLDADRARTAVKALTIAVYDIRTGRLT